MKIAKVEAKIKSYQETLEKGIKFGFPQVVKKANLKLQEATRELEVMTL